MWLRSALLVWACCLWSAEAASRCDCQSQHSCPQALFSGPVKICRLGRRSLGVCCPPSGGGGSGTSGGIRSNCRPLTLCPPAVVNPGSSSLQPCRLQDGSPGVICTDIGMDPLAMMDTGLSRRDNFGGDAESTLMNAGIQPVSASRMLDEAFLSVGSSSVDASRAATAGSQAVEDILSLNTRLLRDSRPDMSSSTGIFNLNFQSNDLVQRIGLNGLQGLLTVVDLQRQSPADMRPVQTFGFSGAGGGSGGGGGGARPPLPRPSRPMRIPNCTDEEPIFCRDERYRTITGECNNLRVPRRGRSLTGFKRLLPNTYEDGIFAIRSRSVTGRQLPSPRLISERVVDTFSNELRGFTLSVMQWGQFIDHDFNHALIFRLDSGAGIECCRDGGQTLPSTLVHPQCIPISIPRNDPFYSQFSQRCMNLVRSLPAPDPDCIARPATPINELTSYLDASNLYGSQEEELDRIRSFRNGLFLTSSGNLLPFFADTAEQQRGGRGGIQFPGRTNVQQTVETPCRGSVCFRAGETRVNEQSALTVIHTIFVREHNRIAIALKRNHPRWNDEKLFQEARRIVIAEWQHIIYNEWLPIVVGFQFAREHGLLPLRTGFSNFYDSTLDATASNEFATSAFRFGHSLLREMYDLVNANGQVTRTVNLTRTFFDPTVVSQSFADHARSLIAQRPETFDRNIISAVHEHLFTTNFRFGLDLISLNIQRGRDHGIPTYVEMLAACSGITVTRWSDLNSLMESSTIDRLRAVYDDPRDVDLFIGGLGENRATAAQVGPTFQCIIGQQFFDLRFGDRFFYDNGGFSHSFSEAQLEQIRRSNWARMLCDTLGPEFGNDLTRVQPLGFVEPSVGPNSVSRCDSLAIPRVDLSVF